MPTTRRSRTVLVGFLGSVVRPMGDWMPISATVELLEDFGLDPASVRTGVSRLKQRGWLEAEARSGARGYRLTDEALEVLATGDELIWHARRPSEVAEGWCVVSTSIPESARARRQQLRAHLASLGFGNVGTAIWIAPARQLPAAERAITELGLVDHAAVFVGRYAFGQDLGAMLRRSWDLDGLAHDYRGFLERYSPLAAELSGGREQRGAEAFRSYLAVVEDWRRLPFHDPGLPRELLGTDWPAQDAGALFGRLVEVLEQPALAHAASYWPDPAPP